VVDTKLLQDRASSSFTSFIHLDSKPSIRFVSFSLCSRRNKTNSVVCLISEQSKPNNITIVDSNIVLLAEKHSDTLVRKDKSSFRLIFQVTSVFIDLLLKSRSCPLCCRLRNFVCYPLTSSFVIFPLLMIMKMSRTHYEAQFSLIHSLLFLLTAYYFN
jgi:hypothetical protein